MVKLGVNIDHVATMRQARGGFDPDPVEAARLCEEAGADSIVAHLREDRRHIQDRDIVLLRKSVKTRFNLEMSVDPDIVAVALNVKPDQATLVPERRQELTTEGGLDVVRHFKRIKTASAALIKKGIEVSLFIAPDKKQIDVTYAMGVRTIELHTGSYARAFAGRLAIKEFAQIRDMVLYARQKGMIVNAGHGLNYDNTYPVARLKGITELNIGHAIMSRALFTGLKQAVRQMFAVIRSAKP
ncbi:MAG: pyridoxine 5'-phosphate synthase [Candidatus Omnitrophica bacterium]|nr:pyridoxine 5'-phosphate synthase [Candidatus Omnitrophota bacterium]MDE2008881.1 pyridoxine 5'-phosphate synthase [Candidatus Omnitrophota bacterium]MDE2213556.1 pyridoxine 5'-phosphate synthase [Candidatus Omnitrophota bacterium]MDE2230543.1 pyridoxine 5'-phosphate synthase [Candidatus Omnitrophota bacterium]